MIAPSSALVHVLSLAIAKLRIDVFRSDLFRMGTECVIYKQLVIHFIYGGLLCDNVRKSRMTTTIPYPLNIPLTLSQNSVRLLHRPRAPGRVIWFTRTYVRSGTFHKYVMCIGGSYHVCTQNFTSAKIFAILFNY